MGRSMGRIFSLAIIAIVLSAAQAFANNCIQKYTDAFNKCVTNPRNDMSLARGMPEINESTGNFTAPGRAARANSQAARKAREHAQKCKTAIQQCNSACPVPAADPTQTATNRNYRGRCRNFRQDQRTLEQIANNNDANRAGARRTQTSTAAGSSPANSQQGGKSPPAGGGPPPPPPDAKQEQPKEQPPKKTEQKTPAQLCSDRNLNESLDNACWRMVGGQCRHIKRGGVCDMSPRAIGPTNDIKAFSGDDSVVKIDPDNSEGYLIQKIGIGGKTGQTVAAFAPTAEEMANSIVLQNKGIAGEVNPDDGTLKLSKEELAKAFLNPLSAKKVTVTLAQKSSRIKELIAANDFCGADENIKILAQGDSQSQSEAQTLRELLDSQLTNASHPSGDFGIGLLCNR